MSVPAVACFTFLVCMPVSPLFRPLSIIIGVVSVPASDATLPAFIPRVEPRTACGSQVADALSRHRPEPAWCLHICTSRTSLVRFVFPLRSIAQTGLARFCIVSFYVSSTGLARLSVIPFPHSTQPTPRGVLCNGRQCQTGMRATASCSVSRKLSRKYPVSHAEYAELAS